MIRNDQHGPRNTISREGRQCQRESRIPGARRKDPLTSQGSLSLITSFFLPTLPFVCFPPTTFSQVTPVQGQRCSALMWKELIKSWAAPAPGLGDILPQKTKCPRTFRPKTFCPAPAAIQKCHQTSVSGRLQLRYKSACEWWVFVKYKTRWSLYQLSVIII